MNATTLDARARDAYEALAPAYDAFTADYPYTTWLERLELLALDHGLAGRRLLDIACGTGSSFVPLLRKGYRVVGCDVSGAMLERARAKAPAAELHVADMRGLPCFGAFDLITCLDDALNYMLTEEELQAAFQGVTRNLAPGGIAIWDLNTIAQYNGQFARHLIVEEAGLFVGWMPIGENAPSDARISEVVMSVFAQVGSGAWERSVSVHRQRHWDGCEVTRSAAAAGLRVLAIAGQRPGALIEPALDEHVHTKAIYVAAANREERS